MENNFEYVNKYNTLNINETPLLILYNNSNRNTA